MKLKCVNVISDYNKVFPKGAVVEATELRHGLCDVQGARPKRNGSPWTGVLSLGHIVVLGVAKFEIIPEVPDEPSV